MSLVSLCFNSYSKGRWQLCVNQELQSRYSFSRDDDWMPKLSDGVSKAGANIVAFKVRKVLQNFGLLDAIGEHFQYVDNANAHATNAGAAVALFGAYCYAFQEFIHVWKLAPTWAAS